MNVKPRSCSVRQCCFDIVAETGNIVAKNGNNAVCRDAARRAGLSATAVLLVSIVTHTGGYDQPELVFRIAQGTLLC